MFRRIPGPGAIFLAVAALAAGNPEVDNYNLPLDRPFTLRNAEPHLLEAEYHRQIAGSGSLYRIFPRPCASEIDSGWKCRENGRWRYHDSARARTLTFSPLAGLEYRYQSESVEALEFGVLTFGHSGPLSFFLDARLYTEFHEDPLHASFDREFVERQDEPSSGSMAYSSYSRFRSNVGYNFPFGRLVVARDAAHWGPGLFTNLVFNQNAVPFNQITLTAHLGPLTVQSLYGRLAPDTNWTSDTSTDFRSVYAHRYEWRAGRNLLFGISEQLLVFKKEAPFAFVPLVPLYIAKAGEKERLNNGNISGDFLARIPGLGTVYSEWLVDDMQSPTSLFDDNWANKWALMAGLHLAHDLNGNMAGLIFEYARVEPWVYTHYIPGTAQTANFDIPLGNPYGPNSQSMIAKAYWRAAGRWSVSLRADLLWKGADSGSSLLDIHAAALGTKDFLRGAGSPKLHLRPAAWWRWGGLGFHAEADLRREPEFVGGIRLQY